MFQPGQRVRVASRLVGLDLCNTHPSVGAEGSVKIVYADGLVHVQLDDSSKAQHYQMFWERELEAL
jgi:hypothetical protein